MKVFSGKSIQVLLTVLVGCYSLSLVCCESHSDDKNLVSPRPSQFRHRRFANFKSVMPSSIDNCIIACGTCGVLEKREINDVSDTEVMCANECLAKDSMLEVLISLLEKKIDKKFARCFLEKTRRKKFIYLNK